MKKKIIEIAKKRYCEEDFKYHILPVVKNALLLAKKLNADKNIVETAAYLHDIGRTIKTKENGKENFHNFTGAVETRKILLSLGAKEDFIKKVEHCVLTHRGRTDLLPQTLEAKIVACADAMAHFEAFLALFKAFLDSGEPLEEVILHLEKKIERDWNKKITFPQAKKMMKRKYEAVVVLIKSLKEYI